MGPASRGPRDLILGFSGMPCVLAYASLAPILCSNSAPASEDPEHDCCVFATTRESATRQFSLRPTRSVSAQAGCSTTRQFSSKLASRVVNHTVQSATNPFRRRLAWVFGALYGRTAPPTPTPCSTPLLLESREATVLLHCYRVYGRRPWDLRGRRGVGGGGAPGRGGPVPW